MVKCSESKEKCIESKCEHSENHDSCMECVGSSCYRFSTIQVVESSQVGGITVGLILNAKCIEVQ